MPQAAIALLISIVPFAVSTSFTPGPNNLMMASSGAAFGFRRTVPPLIGVVLGFSLMNLLVGLSVAEVITTFPPIFIVIKAVGVAYFVYLAWRIATSEGAKGRPEPRKPLTFLQAAAFQWVNPKAWIMAVGAVATYTTTAVDLRPQVVLITATFLVIGFASTSTWAVFGVFISRFLTTRRRRIAFNYSMAGLLLASIAPVIAEGL